MIKTARTVTVLLLLLSSAQAAEVRQQTTTTPERKAPSSQPKPQGRTPGSLMQPRTKTPQDTPRVKTDAVKTGASAQAVKITFIRGTVKGIVAGKSVAEYYGGCNKIIIQAEKSNHEKADPITCEAVPAQNYCSFKQLLPDPHYYSISIPSPAGFIAKWEYSCNFPGSDKDRICEAKLKDVLALSSIQTAANVASVAGVLQTIPPTSPDAPNLIVYNVWFETSPFLYDSHIVGKLLNAIAVVQNTGTRPSPEAQVRVDGAKDTSGNPTVQSGSVLKVPALAPNEQHTKKFKTIVTSCKEGIKVIMDPENKILETKEDDNSTFRGFSAWDAFSGENCYADEAAYQASLLPDLSMFAAHFKKNGNYQELDYTVENGNFRRSTFPKAKTALFLGGQKVKEWPQVHQGDNTFGMLTPACGETYTIVLDPDHQVSELDESNNTAAATYTCK